MTVKELIEKLSKYNQNDLVYIHDSSCGAVYPVKKDVISFVDNQEIEEWYERNMRHGSLSGTDPRDVLEDLKNHKSSGIVYFSVEI